MFTFSKVKMILLEKSSFSYSENIRKRIVDNEFVWFGSSVHEVTLKVNKEVSHYFERRGLLPYQEIFSRNDSGDLFIRSKVHNFVQVAPIIQYWIPNVHVVSPVELDEFVKKNIAIYSGG